MWTMLYVLELYSYALIYEKEWHKLRQFFWGGAGGEGGGGQVEVN